MEIPVIITLLVLVLIVFPIWAIIKILSLGRENDSIARQLLGLEEELADLRHKLSDAGRAAAPEVTPPIATPAPAPPAPPSFPPARPKPVETPPPLPPVMARPIAAAGVPREILRSASPPPTYVPPAPTPSVLAKIDWEQFMGAKLFAWLGGVAALLGLAFFVKYSFEHDLIPPEVRVTLGYLFAAALLVSGLKLAGTRYQIGSQTLIATGIVSLYAVTFACNSTYHFAFFGPLATFLLMSLVTAAAFLLAVRFQARVIAVLGMLGGFLTPVLLSTEQDNPPGLFGYIALLDAGLVAVALHRRWNFLLTLAAVGTVLMQIGWAARFLRPDTATTAMVVCLAFCGLFLVAYVISRRLAGAAAEYLGAAIAFPFVAFGFAVVLFDTMPATTAHGRLLAFIFLADACLLAIAWMDRRVPRLHQVAGVVVFALLAAWTGKVLNEARLPLALAAYLVHALLHTTFPVVRQRRHPDVAANAWDQVFPALALLLMLGPLFKLDSVSLLYWPSVLVVDVLAIALAVFTASLAGVVAVLVLTLVATAAWLFQVPATIAAEPSLLLVIGGFAVLFFSAGIFLARRLGAAVGERLNRTIGAPGAQLPACSVLLPFVLLILMTQRVPLVNPSPVFGLGLLLVVLTLGLTAIVLRDAGGTRPPSTPAPTTGAGAANRAMAWLPAAALAGIAALEYAWFSRHPTPQNATLQLAWYLLFYGVFAAFPFVGRRWFAALTGPWAVAALAGPSQFPLVYRTVARAWPNDIMGVLPALFAIAPLFSLFLVLRSRGSSERARLNQLAWFGGAALFFVTLIFPIQFERQWITLGWALEGAALLWLYHRVAHPGLRATGAVLLVAAFARLALNPAVLEYHARSATPIFNWYLYSFGLVTACLFAGAWLTAPPRDRVLGISAPPLLQTLGTILAFLLLNVEIADYFSPAGGRALTFHFSGNFARDMTYTIAWALFALALLLVGIWRVARASRYAGIALLAVALAKLFLHDLARLEALYRIGALFAVAIIATVASFAYQRFLPTAKNNDASP